jgi:hypothetical protein
MDIDPRDAVWDETHDLLYNTRYTAGIEQALLARWTWLDSITKIAVAISSGGGALAGLVFWKNSDYTFLWPVFTSASALLAIVSRQLSVAEKINRHATAATSLTLLAVNIESLIVRMKVNAVFSITEFEKKLLGLRDKYGSEYSKLQHDLLLTEKIRTNVQEKLNIAINTSQC